MYGYIYLMLNKVNGKTYVGKHESSKEWFEDKYPGSGILLKPAQKKYGIENFEKFLIQYCYDKDSLNTAEEFWIAEYKRRGKAEYNIAKGGEGGNLGEEVCKRISEALKEHSVSEETRKKISESNKGKHGYWKGKHLSEEHKRRIGEAERGNQHMKGKHMSEESRNKMSETAKLSKARKERHWYNNGTKNILSKTCPEGFVSGRLK